ncbi:hypothetical protein [Halomonas sp. WWR20]
MKDSIGLGALLAFAVLLSGCVGGERLSVSMATINQEYGELQDEALLLNILRRSASRPAHFTSLSTIRGRSRINAGANLSVPFGADAPSQFTFNPQVSIEQGPWFEVALLDNQEFYRRYLTPISTTRLNDYVQQNFPLELLLTLFLERIHVHTPDRDIQAVNAPDRPDQYQDFQGIVRRFVSQGLTLETIGLVNQVGPSLHMTQPPNLDDLLSVHQRGLALQQTDDAHHYQLVRVREAARFCFSHAQEPLFAQAYCDFGVGHQYAATDPLFFGSTGRARISFVSEQGTIELYTRSLAEVLDYLGGVIRAQQTHEHPLKIHTAQGWQPLLRVMPASGLEHVLVATEFDGTRYAIPTGPEGGQSGQVLTVVSQLLAQAQSLKNMPRSNTVTVVGD